MPPCTRSILPHQLLEELKLIILTVPKFPPRWQFQRSWGSELTIQSGQVFVFVSFFLSLCSFWVNKWFLRGKYRHTYIFFYSGVISFTLIPKSRPKSAIFLHCCVYSLQSTTYCSRTANPWGVGAAYRPCNRKERSCRLRTKCDTQRDCCMRDMVSYVRASVNQLLTWTWRRMLLLAL
jgi:hypothetical protein